MHKIEARLIRTTFPRNMALPTLSSLSFFLLSLIFVTSMLNRGGFHYGWKKNTHLHFYFHDIVTAPPKQTAIHIGGPLPTSNSTEDAFGATLMADEPLTEGPELTSKLIGRAQGLYGYAAQDEVAFLMVFNFAFTEGKYKGSTLTLLGRNVFLSDEREMPIVGGSGYFRGARGYALEKTHSVDLDTLNAVVEYNVHVTHY